MNTTDIANLGAAALREKLARGDLKAVDVAVACLQRIEADEPRVQAWAFLDRDLVMQQAEAADQRRAEGRSLGPLHGLPVGVKDIIDTADMPTENGTIIDAGRRPSEDATIVARLRATGAIVMGKTVTTELANYWPGKTRNPHDPERTPGGSSSGSAAAVAAGMVPLAIGTQTFGSVIRPASFCGVVGFKPTHGLIPRTGVLLLSAPLDTIGVFANSIGDAALLVDALAGHDAGDPATRVAAPPRLSGVAESDPPAGPKLAFVKTPAWGEAETATKEGFGELVEVLGEACTEVSLPDPFTDWPTAHRILMQAEMARNLETYYRRKEGLSEQITSALESGMAIGATDYLAALACREMLSSELDRLLDRYDAIITPAAAGEAPEGLASTGNPIFNGLWTLCGVPAVTLPLLTGPNNLPVGVQLVGRRGEDGRLLRTARWLSEALRQAGQDASVVLGGKP